MPRVPRKRETRSEAALAPENAPLVSSSANAMSLADWNLCSGLFSRQWRTTRSRAAGMGRPVADGSGGSSRRTAVIVSAAVSRWNAR
jgi:hypothetical protein